MPEPHHFPARVLVTGGCGFIGANLVPLLIDRGAHVRVLDDCSAGLPSRLPAAAELVRGDMDYVQWIRDAAALGAALEWSRDQLKRRAEAGPDEPEEHPL